METQKTHQKSAFKIVIPVRRGTNTVQNSDRVQSYKSLEVLWRQFCVGKSNAVWKLSLERLLQQRVALMQDFVRCICKRVLKTYYANHTELTVFPSTRLRFWPNKDLRHSWPHLIFTNFYQHELRPQHHTMADSIHARPISVLQI